MDKMELAELIEKEEIEEINDLFMVIFWRKKTVWVYMCSYREMLLRILTWCYRVFQYSLTEMPPDEYNDKAHYVTCKQLCRGLLQTSSVENVAIKFLIILE